MTMFRDLGSRNKIEISKLVVSRNFASQNPLLPLWIDEIGCAGQGSEGIWNF